MMLDDSLTDRTSRTTTALSILEIRYMNQVLRFLSDLKQPAFLASDTLCEELASTCSCEETYRLRSGIYMQVSHSFNFSFIITSRLLNLTDEERFLTCSNRLCLKLMQELHFAEDGICSATPALNAYHIPEGFRLSFGS